MSWIATYTGKRFDLLKPTPDMVDIEDIAHALSNIGRFTGHTREFYSVAQHSVLAASYVDSDLAFQALMHDATEAYVNDIARPLKKLLPEYQAAEERVWLAICAAFGLPVELHPDIKVVDNRLCVTEARSLMRNRTEGWELKAEPFDRPIRPWRPSTAKTRFLDAFSRYHPAARA